jgi:DNA-binding MarR family transcriptional regulator
MQIDYNFIKNLRNKIRLLEREFDFQLKSETTCCGITLSQCHIIIELAERGRASIKELSETFGLDKSTLSRTVDGMVEAGYVNRITNKEDRRFFDLSLTEKGAEKADFINSQCNKYYAEALRSIPVEKQNLIIESLSLLGNIMAGLRKCWPDENNNCCNK